MTHTNEVTIHSGVGARACLGRGRSTLADLGFSDRGGEVEAKIINKYFVTFLLFYR
ncbi:MAG: hypothetical protein GY820_03820 [Gammaproteobacteria bacterium]|nr:hypothetical protein [Gammaproteobacteria bacterium]